MSTVAAISTPNAAGGIGIIRISGPQAIGIAEKCFRPVSGRSVAAMAGYTAAYGQFTNGDEILDDGVLLVYRAPKSYTGEDVAELCCHGGIYVTQKVLSVVLACGASPAGPGEFTKRAFLNGKMDLAQAESVMQIISAQGEAALTAAETALQGSVSRKIDEICRRLVGAAAALAVWADYPEEDVPPVENAGLAETLSACEDALAKLIRDYENGRAVTEGVNTVICGKPNVGKSTLMNLLAGCDRSIVTPVAGTTRDVVEDTVRLGSVLLHLSDTAGLHETDDTVEKIGVDRARQRLERASLVLAVFDLSRPLTEEDDALLSLCRAKRAVAVLNKADLPHVWDKARITEKIPHAVTVSARDEGSIETLRSAVEDVLGVEGLDFTEELLTSARQKNCCVSALSNIRDALSALAAGMTADAVSVDVDCAVNELYALTGKRATEEVVNEVFRRFCVGK
ncbi:MAG: tRNA uridine-5-carboxymethylaminomethyl(34) synthesis GTPase MnmE [Clostridia bacterium]|nr:tRNA uridine-5-carboxymethylaminomethyl(34) synthesis GTPase MnmE [Clostridia bacterium]